VVQELQQSESEREIPVREDVAPGWQEEVLRHDVGLVEGSSVFIGCRSDDGQRTRRRPRGIGGPEEIDTTDHGGRTDHTDNDERKT